jgi:hypothetical protein
MREKLAAARRLVSEGFAQLVAVYGGEDEIRLAGEMKTSSFDDGVGVREVDVAIDDVDRHAGERPGSGGFLP